jgi:deoxyribodipyrimidine photolyase-related protein
MKIAHLVYPNQLFGVEHIPKDTSTIVLVEEPLFFGTDQQYPVYFHKSKLMLHRASMRRYIEEVLWPAGFDVEYIPFNQLIESGDIIQKFVKFDKITVWDVVDDVLSRRLQTASTTIPEAPSLEVLTNPGFYLTASEVSAHFASSKKANFTDFYLWQRERFNILISENYRPVGGRLSFENEEVKRLKKDQKLPTFQVYGGNKFVDEARDYIRKHFNDNPGNDEEFPWPTNHQEASAWLDEFVNNRLDDYWLYSQALDAKAPWLYHSVISSSLNIGILSPAEAVERALVRHQQREVPLASLEGFIRQILGWREFIRGQYVTSHVTWRSSNEFNHKRLLGPDWYSATTGIPLVDDVIKKLINRAYVTHAERRLVCGLMLLTEISPNEVYQWNMELFIDAYDWVSVPNVFGLSQMADGSGLSSAVELFNSDDVMAMSHYEKGVWADVWDGLYWRFIENNREKLSKQKKYSTIIHQLDQLDQAKKRIISYRADDFLATKTKAANQS